MAIAAAGLRGRSLLRLRGNVVPPLGGTGSSYASTSEDGGVEVTRCRENQGRAVCVAFAGASVLGGGWDKRGTVCGAPQATRVAYGEELFSAAESGLSSGFARWANRNNCLHFAQPTVAAGNGGRCLGQKTTKAFRCARSSTARWERTHDLTQRVLLMLTTARRHRAARAERYLPGERGG